MPWTLFETHSHYSGESPALHLRFIKHSKVDETEAHTNVRWLPPQADPSNDIQVAASIIQSNARLPASNIYKPSIFSRSFSSSQLAGQTTSQVWPFQQQTERQERQHQFNDVYQNHHKPHLQQQAPSNRRAMSSSDAVGEIFRFPAVPLVPSALVQSSVAQRTASLQAGRTSAIVIHSPRRKPATPRQDFDTLEPAQGGGKRPQFLQLTPRSQKELDISAARLAQRKNMVMQHVKRLQNKDWASRKCAVDALASLVAADASVLEYVMVLLESRNNKSRETAVWAISRIVNKGDAEAVEMLLRRIECPSFEVRMAALAALSHVAVKSAPAAVQGALARLGHRDWNVREAAVDALQHVASAGDVQVLQGLAQCIIGDADWRVRQVAIESIGTFLDRSMTSVRAALECFVAVCASSAAAERGESAGALQLSITSYRAMLASVGVPLMSGVCKGCRNKGQQAAEERFGCLQCLEGVRSWANTILFQKVALAFLMGGHARLGERSWIRALDPELMPIIFAYV